MRDRKSASGVGLVAGPCPGRPVTVLRGSCLDNAAAASTPGPTAADLLNQTLFDLLAAEDLVSGLEYQFGIGVGPDNPPGDVPQYPIVEVTSRLRDVASRLVERLRSVRNRVA